MVIEPSGLTKDQAKIWAYTIQNAEFNYFAMLEAGAKPQQARSVLPTCLKTEIVMTANFREWAHFIRLRASPVAHPDIQPLALEIQRILAAACPSVFTSVG